MKDYLDVPLSRTDADDAAPTCHEEYAEPPLNRPRAEVEDAVEIAAPGKPATGRLRLTPRDRAAPQAPEALRPNNKSTPPRLDSALAGDPGDLDTGLRAQPLDDPEPDAKPRLRRKRRDGQRVEARISAKARVAPAQDDGPVISREKVIDDVRYTRVNDPKEPPVSGGGKGDGGDITGTGGGGGNGGGEKVKFHKRVGPENFGAALRKGLGAVWTNLSMVMVLTCATNILILAIPVYLFQISDRVLTSRSIDTLVMLTIVIAGAVILQAILDAVRRFMLMRTAVEVAARLGAPILSAAAHASLHGTGREYQTLGDLQQVRGFLVSGTLISFLDVPFAPLFILAIFLVHPHLGLIVITTALALLVIALINQKITAKPFAAANLAQAKANQHLDSMSRNSQIINALAMIPEAVTIWGRDTAESMKAQVRAQDRNIVTAAASRAVRLLTQIGMLGWGAYLAIDGQITGGMVIAASIIAGRALAPIEGAIEGWNAFLLSRAAYGRISKLLNGSALQFERLHLPHPEGRLDVERLLYVPGGTKQVVLNGLSFHLNPGETLAVIGNSGAGKTTLGKMLVGSILPTSGNVRLDLMDLRNWDPRQLGENIGYLPQDVQLFPGTIKDNIARMRPDATDEQIHEAAVLADVHEMIATLPQGYETVVAADGAPLSGGQKQRIALARAFFGNPRMVVLDEPNSNLDVAGDKALARAIGHAKANKITVVVITQKPALLNAVDKIMLLADGTVGLFGNRDAVLKKLAESHQAKQMSGAAPNSIPKPQDQAGPAVEQKEPQDD